MKNATRNTGLITSLMILAGCFLKLQHWPFGGPLLILGTSAFVIGFLPLYMIVRVQSKKSVLDIFEGIFTLLFGSIFMIGLMFRIQHWPMGYLFFQFGIIGMVLLLPLVLVNARKRNPAEGGWAALGFLIAITILIMGMSIKTSRAFDRSMKNTAIQLETSVESMQHQVNHALNLLQSKNDSLASAQAAHVHDRTSKTIAWIDTLEFRIVLAHLDHSSNILHFADWKNVVDVMQPDPASSLLIGYDPGQDEWRASQLKNQVLECAMEIRAIAGDPSDTASFHFMTHFPFADKENPFIKDGAWEQETFYLQPYISSIITLKQLRLSLLQLENDLIMRLMADS